MPIVQKLIGDFHDHIVYEDTFTPLTINKFTSKKEGAIYGSPVKVKDGGIGFTNLFLAGTDHFGADHLGNGANKVLGVSEFVVDACEANVGNFVQLD